MTDFLKFFGLCLLLSTGFFNSVFAGFKEADEASKKRDWVKVLAACKADAEAGEKNCQSHLGALYKYGWGVERNPAVSADYLKRCSSQGQMYCEEMLGDSYRWGVGVGVNYEEAIRLFRLAAGKGNPWAFNNLAGMYRQGQGVKKDPIEARKNFQLAADKGNGLGQANLADMYRLGEGIEKNPDLSFQWAVKSSKQNFGAGWNILGLLYRDGVGVRQDTAQAVEAFKRAVDPSATWPSTIAYANLAGIYYNGRGVPVDLDEAHKWALEGTLKKNKDSMQLLSSILARGGRTTKADHKRAFELATEAYKLGSVEAGGNLGWFYRDGIGTTKDLDQSMRYFSEAAEKGSPGAFVGLGRIYIEGIGVPKDPQKGREYLLLAKSQMQRLGVGRQYVEDYFANEANDASKQKNTDPSKPTVPSIAQSSDGLQKSLLEKIEKLQQQIESLQAATNSMSHLQVMQSTLQYAPRKALVIGNDRYQNVPVLMNAKQDAAAMANSLKSLGYTVYLHQDLDEKGFKQALREFRANLDGGEEVLFFYAGHGVQLGAANYLLPVDTKGDNEEQVKDEAVELQRILDDLKARNTKFALAVIDACRDNPFKKSGRAIGGRGLAPTTAATGQMIMFSAGAGQQALDKLGSSDASKNGVFTRVLLKEMSKPGVPVDRVLRNVRNEVVRLAKSVGHEQTPALYDQAVGDFYFAFK
jgi:TPR repeat protein